LTLNPLQAVIPTWIALVEGTSAEFQNLQELTSIWDNIRLEIEELNSEIEITDTYALLGRYDSLLVVASDWDSVSGLSLTVEGHGLDMTTMRPYRALGIPTGSQVAGRGVDPIFSSVCLSPGPHRPARSDRSWPADRLHEFVLRRNTRISSSPTVMILRPR
jgi:uncharacterized protein with GYD domain